MKQMNNSNRIRVSDDIFKNEYEYYFGSKKDVLVKYIFINTRTHHESVRKMPYSICIQSAFSKCNDKRCKNFEYEITL